MVAPIEGFLPSQSTLDLVNPINPHGSEGFSLSERAEALATLPFYAAQVITRVAFRESETTESGARIYSELVHMVDSNGRRIVRELTIGEPNPDLGESRTSPFAWVETDPWLTGADGLNRDKVKAYTALGMPVFWLHHGSEHTAVVRDKSVSRSAHQMHATLDDLSLTAAFDTKTVMVGGFSRGAMTGDKFIVVAEQYGREVPYSDLEALCFAQDMTTAEKAMTIIEQLPREIIGVGQLVLKVYKRGGLQGLREFAGTLNPNIKNVRQEGYWAPALVNSDVQRFINLLPPQTSGIRVFSDHDVMSQQRKYEALYKMFPDIAVLTEKGPHVIFADPDYLDKKYQRMGRVMDYLEGHDRSLAGIRPDDVLPPAEALPLRRQRRLFRASA